MDLPQLAGATAAEPIPTTVLGLVFVVVTSVLGLVSLMVRGLLQGQSSTAAAHAQEAAQNGKDLARLSSRLDAHEAHSRRETDAIRREMDSVGSRVAAIEGREHAAAAELRSRGAQLQRVLDQYGEHTEDDDTPPPARGRAPSP